MQRTLGVVDGPVRRPRRPVPARRRGVNAGKRIRITSLELSCRAAAQIGQMVHAQTRGDPAQPLTAGCEEAAQQPATWNQGPSAPIDRVPRWGLERLALPHYDRSCAEGIGVERFRASVDLNEFGPDCEGRI